MGMSILCVCTSLLCLSVFLYVYEELITPEFGVCVYESEVYEGYDRDDEHRERQEEDRERRGYNLQDSDGRW